MTVSQKGSPACDSGIFSVPISETWTGFNQLEHLRNTATTMSWFHISQFTIQIYTTVLTISRDSFVGYFLFMIVLCLMDRHAAATTAALSRETAKTPPAATSHDQHRAGQRGRNRLRVLHQHPLSAGVRLPYVSTE